MCKDCVRAHQDCTLNGHCVLGDANCPVQDLSRRCPHPIKYYFPKNVENLSETDQGGPRYYLNRPDEYEGDPWDD